MVAISVKPIFSIGVLTLFLVLVVFLLSSKLDIWSVGRMVEWRPCVWWLQGYLTALPSKSNGFIRVDCYRGLNQTRRDLCDGVGIAHLLSTTLVLPKFEVAAYWNESRATIGDCFKKLVHVDCSKRKGQFGYIETVLPALLEHHYISITPTMRQIRDRYLNTCVSSVCKASLCQACYSTLRLTKSVKKRPSKLLEAIPKLFLSLHLRFEPDKVSYSQYRKPWTGELAQIWRKRGKCPLTPNETAFKLKVLSIPTNTNIYLAAGDGLMEIEGLTSVYTNVVTKSSLLSGEDFKSMHGNTKAALDYYVSINSDSYIAKYFGNMDKMVAAMRAFNGMYKTLFLSRRAYAEFTCQGLRGKELMRALWKVHEDDFVMGEGSAFRPIAFVSSNYDFRCQFDKYFWVQIITTH
ncbi:unnamed protein product [Malus baccata var. baccata]